MGISSLIRRLTDMNIQKEQEKSKVGLTSKLFIPILIIVVAIGSVMIGRWWNNRGGPVNSSLSTIASPVKAIPTVTIKKGDISSTSPEESGVGGFVASKKGHVFYGISCSQAKKISVSNKIFFSSAEEAEKAGFKQSTSCTVVKSPN